MERVEPARSSSSFRPSSPRTRRTSRRRTLDCVQARCRPPSTALPCSAPSIPQIYRQGAPPTQEVDQSMLTATYLVSRYRSEEHTSELQSRRDLVCRLLLEKKKKKTKNTEQDNIN